MTITNFKLTGVDDQHPHIEVAGKRYQKLESPNEFIKFLKKYRSIFLNRSRVMLAKEVAYKLQLAGEQVEQGMVADIFKLLVAMKHKSGSSIFKSDNSGLRYVGDISNLDASSISTGELTELVGPPAKINPIKKSVGIEDLGTDAPSSPEPEVEEPVADSDPEPSSEPVEEGQGAAADSDPEAEEPVVEEPVVEPEVEEEKPTKKRGKKSTK